MENREFVKKQFEFFKKNKARYREVLILTSFIETIIRGKAGRNEKPKDFKSALESLGLRIDDKNKKKASYEQGSQYKKDYLVKINLLRVQRNELLHDIIKERFPKEYIDKVIKEMAKNIRLIYTKSKLIRNYFKNNSDYKFDPARLI